MGGADIATIIAAIAAAITSIGGMIFAAKAASRASVAGRAVDVVAEETKQLHNTVNSQLSKFSDAEAKRADAEGYLRAMVENAITARELLSQNKAEEAARLLIAQAEARAHAAGIIEGAGQASGTKIPPQTGQNPTPGTGIPVQLGEGMGTSDKPMQVEVVQPEEGPVPVKVVNPEEDRKK